MNRVFLSTLHLPTYHAMIPRIISQKLRSPQTLPSIIDHKNAHTLTPAKTRPRAGRRISSPRVVDSLNRASTRRTLEASDDTYLNESPQQPQTNEPDVVLPRSSESIFVPMNSHQTTQHSQAGNTANLDLLKNLTHTYPGFSNRYLPTKGDEFVHKSRGHTTPSSAGDGLAPPGPSYSSESRPQPLLLTPSHRQSSGAEHVAKRYTSRKNLYHMQNSEVSGTSGIFGEEFVDRVAIRVAQKMNEGLLHGADGRDRELVSKIVVEELNNPAVPNQASQKGPPGRPVTYTTVAPLYHQETQDVEYCWKNRATRKKRHLHQMREEVRRRVEMWIQKVFGRSYTVEFFGSLRYDVSYLTSDLDMVILDQKRPRGFDVPDLYATVPIYNLKTLADVLRRSGFVDVSYRQWASVPIVQFRDPKSNFECDINVNDRLGVINSDLLKRYTEMCPILRPLLYEVKEWAKPLSLNSPTGGKGISASFSSYALALMTVGFLQDRYGLPSLQQNLPELPPLSSVVLNVPEAYRSEDHEHLTFTKKPHQGWDTRYHKEGLPWVTPFTKNVKGVKQEWARYWTEFPHKTHAIDIRAGGVVERPLNSMDTICVMDPFITTKNVARGVSTAVFDYFVKQCEMDTP